MKNKLILGAALLMAAVTETLACTNFIVGKNASTDGSVIVSYSADSYGMFGELYHYPAGVHAKGTMRDIHEWDTGRYYRYYGLWQSYLCCAPTFAHGKRSY